ncbi:MAG: stage II sporulation protein R [Oscillospiraceae bacterium]|nr:stage II sporulation protein R [Oscillospiraceae bacterium]
MYRIGHKGSFALPPKREERGLWRRERPRLRRWELALLLALGAALLGGLWLEGEQAGLSGSLIRLHVLANSDSEEDQALKLKVRDQVLEQAGQLLEQADSLEQARQVLEDNLPLLERAGQTAVNRAGYDYPVSVSLEQAWFPTKEYEDFALPAGTYQALRVVIGQGEGQNWWCVVFPPLCLSSATESAAEIALDSGVSEQQTALMTGESEGYVIKFKALELWDSLKRLLS